MQFHRVLAQAISVACVSSFVGLGSPALAQSSSTFTPPMGPTVAVPAEVNTAILNQIAKRGQAQVIVEVAVPTNDAIARPQAATDAKPLSSSEIAARVASIQRDVTTSTDPVMRALASADINVTQSFTNLPMLVTTVDLAQYERLQRIPGVLKIYPNDEIRLEQTVIEPVAAPAPSPITHPPALSGAELVAAEQKQLQDAVEKATESYSNTYINATQLHAKGFTGAGQTVVIIDDGVQTSHTSFQGKIAAEACFGNVSNTTTDTTLCTGGVTSLIGTGAASSNCGGTNEVCGHGTHVAGIAAGADGAGSSGSTIRGVAYGAKIIPIQVFYQVRDTTRCDGSATCTLTNGTTVLAALNHVISLASSNTIAAVNMSIGGGTYSSYCDTDVRKPAIDTLRGLGILTVIAAGNDGLTGSISAPGCVSTATTVSSTIITSADSTVNHASTVDLLAPGVLIISAGLNNTQATKSGTSMATPQVTGAIALLRSAIPNSSGVLLELALKLTGPLTTRSTWSWSTPRIDVNAAFTLLTTRAFPITNIQPSNSAKSLSFLRFHNTGTTSGTVTVTLYNNATDTNLGTWTKTIPALSAIQVGAADIERELSKPITPAADQGTYNAFISRSFSGFVQHVLYNPGGAALTNVTTCEAGPSKNAKYLFNSIHTSRLPTYPSYLAVHNNSSTAAKPSFKIYDANTGAFINRFTLTNNITPFTTATVPMINLLDNVGSPATASQFHINIELEGSWTGAIQHLVDNVGAGVITDMSVKCDF